MHKSTGETPAPVKRYQWERVLKRSDAPRMAKHVGLTLATYTNADGTNAHPGIPRLMADCSIESDRTVRSALKALVDLGLIHRTFHASRAGRSRLSDVYVLTDPSVEPPVIHDVTTGNPAHTDYLPPTHDTSPDLHHADARHLARTTRDDEDPWTRIECRLILEFGRDLTEVERTTLEKMTEQEAHPRMVENTIRRDMRETDAYWSRRDGRDPWGDPPPSLVPERSYDEEEPF